MFIIGIYALIKNIYNYNTMYILQNISISLVNNIINTVYIKVVNEK